MKSKRRRKKNTDQQEQTYSFHIERKMIHGQMVDVKVYEKQEVPEDTHITRPGIGQWWKSGEDD